MRWSVTMVGVSVGGGGGPKQPPHAEASRGAASAARASARDPAPMPSHAGELLESFTAVAHEKVSWFPFARACASSRGAVPTWLQPSYTGQSGWPLSFVTCRTFESSL